MEKNLRVLKLVPEIIPSVDGTDWYEVPVGWRPITMAELAVSQFNNELPVHIEQRQFNWEQSTLPYGRKRIHATLYWYADKTGIAFHKEWVYKNGEGRNSGSNQDGWQLSCYAFGCKHQYRELSAEECRAIGVAHYGNCWHVHRCELCKYINSYDSSD